MKKLQFILFAVIFVTLAVKAISSSPAPVEYAALSTDTKVEEVQQFFKYKVNNVQNSNNYQVENCMIYTSVCCNA